MNDATEKVKKSCVKGVCALVALIPILFLIWLFFKFFR